MPLKICLISKYNQYETKLHFAQKLAEAFRRQGAIAEVFDGDYWAKMVIDVLEQFKPDMILSFNRSIPGPDGVYWYDRLGVNLHSLLVDPVYYELYLLGSPRAFITCVDRGDVDFVKKKGFNRVVFLPHAVERDLFDHREQTKEFEVSLVGSCYDPETMRSLWQRKFSPSICSIIEEAIRYAFSSEQPHFLDATLEVAKSQGIDEAEVLAKELPYYVDYYMRGEDRLRLIQSIRDVPVHVFGGTLFPRETMRVKGWNDYLREQKNVVLHPTMPFVEALNVFKKSKICLNSVPSFPDGAHERVFTSLACNSFPFTTASKYLHEEFGENIGFYQYQNLSEVNDRIVALLANEEERLEKVQRARTVALARHTWDQRAQTLLEFLKDSSQ